MAWEGYRSRLCKCNDFNVHGLFSRDYTQVVKMVVASAVNEQGESIHPRKWNHEFIDMPIIHKNDQKRPAHTGEVVTKIIAATKTEKYRTLLALCAAGGLRLGEALGIDIKNVSPNGTTIKICQKVWKGQVHNFLKTTNGKREIDLHSWVGTMLRKYIGEKESGLLFCSKAGKPLGQSNILRRTLHPILAELGQPKCGAHAFRRFRLTWLRQNTVPKDLEHFWMGHADEEVGDLYSQLESNFQFRKEMAERIGLGFELPSEDAVVGLNGRKFESEPVLEMATSA
jgi:integrase